MRCRGQARVFHSAASARIQLFILIVCSCAVHKHSKRNTLNYDGISHLLARTGYLFANVHRVHSSRSSHRSLRGLDVPDHVFQPCGVSVTSTLTTTHTALMPTHPACSICPTMCSNLAWSAWRVQRPPYSHRTHLHPVCSVCSTICPTMCPTLRQQLGTHIDHRSHRTHLHPACSVWSTICPTMCPTLRQQLGTYNDHGPNRKDLVRQIPVRGIRDVTPPFISCVSLDRTDGDFESNLASLKLVEGRDYYLFG